MKKDAVEEVQRIIMLIDFFGELLTDRQRYFMNAYYNDNLTLSEIAGNEGITRQAVRDMLARSRSLIEEYEAKTGACAKYLKQLVCVQQMEACLFDVHALNLEKLKNQALVDLCNRMYDALNAFKSED
jgi:predicted DNA-binding protein YlxM (UPF0122 family)